MDPIETVIPPATIRDFALVIAGERVATEQVEWLAHVNDYIQDFKGTLTRVRQANRSGQPAPEDLARFHARVAIVDAEQHQQVIEAAYRVAQIFADTSYEQRKRLILDIGAALEAHRPELMELGVCEGRPKISYRHEMDFHYAPGGTFTEPMLDYWIRQLRGEKIDRTDGIFYFPYGVVGFAPPGNGPLYNGVIGMMGAVLAGNSLIVKPPRNRAAQTMRFVEICEQVARRHGFPGLFHAVVGESRDIIEAWGESPLVDAVVFYGGSGLGLEVGAQLTKKFTKAVLELSGSDALLVWKDADLDAAAEAIHLTRFLFGSGMVCVSPKRLLVHRDVYQPLVDRLVARLAESWQVGLPDQIDREPYLLPVMELDRKICAATLEDARKAGHTILSGGRWLDHTGAEHPDGVFLEPTLIAGVTPDSHCWKHEIFGPILPIMPVEDLESAIEQVNNSIYGLRASVWTHDPRVMGPFVKRAKTGSVFVNDHPLYYNGIAPFLGGVKASGLTGAKYFHLELSIRRYVHVGRGRTGTPEASAHLNARA